MVCPICAVPVFLPGIPRAGMWKHSCQPFLALFRLKLDLPHLTNLLPAGNCLPDPTTTAIGPFWVLDASVLSGFGSFGVNSVH